MIVTTENPKDSTKKLVKSKSESSKYAEHKVNIQKSKVYPYSAQTTGKWNTIYNIKNCFQINLYIDIWLCTENYNRLLNKIKQSPWN